MKIMKTNTYVLLVALLVTVLCAQAFAGMLVFSKDAAFNKNAPQVSSDQEAVQRVQDFLKTHAKELGIAPPPADVRVSVECDTDEARDGWQVTLEPYVKDVHCLPRYVVYLKRPGIIDTLVYNPKDNDTPLEPVLTKEQARDAVLKHKGLTGEYTFEKAYLRQWREGFESGPDVLQWMLTLDPVDKTKPKVMTGCVNAITGEVLLVGMAGGAPDSWHPGTQVKPQAQAQTPPAQQSPSAALPIALVSVAIILLLGLLVFKLRKH